MRSSAHVDASSHFGDHFERNVVSPISTLGDLIPVLAGVALGARLQGKHKHKGNISSPTESGLLPVKKIV